MTFRTWLVTAAVVAGLFGAALGLCAASIEIHNNIDAFMDDMGRKARWATWAAVAACVAAGLSAIERLVPKS